MDELVIYVKLPVTYPALTTLLMRNAVLHFAAFVFCQLGQRTQYSYQ